MRTTESPRTQDRGYEQAQGYQGGESGWSRHGAYEDRDVGRRDDQGRDERQRHQGGREPGYDYDREQGGRGSNPGDGAGWGGYQQSGREGQRLDRPHDEQRRDGHGRFIGKGPRGYRRSDERITEDVNEQLTAHGEIDAEDIEVKVVDGEVTLTGTVESRQIKRLVEDVVAELRGVRDVHNQLRVGRGQSSSSGAS